MLSQGHLAGEANEAIYLNGMHAVHSPISDTPDPAFHAMKNFMVTAVSSVQCAGSWRIQQSTGVPWQESRADLSTCAAWPDTRKR